MMRTMKDKEGPPGPRGTGGKGDIEADSQRKGGLDIRSCGSIWTLRNLTD